MGWSGEKEGCFGSGLLASGSYREDMPMDLIEINTSSLGSNLTVSILKSMAYRPSESGTEFGSLFCQAKWEVSDTIRLTQKREIYKV